LIKDINLFFFHLNSVRSVGSAPATWLVATLVVNGCYGTTVTPVQPSPPPPSLTGAWAGSFEMPRTMLAGAIPIEAHPVSVELTLHEERGRIGGFGAVEGLLGRLAPLAFVKGPQRGEVSGILVNDVAEIQLAIPPFGSPPAAVHVVFRGEISDGVLTGVCLANLGGTESEPAPCKLTARGAPSH